MRYVEFRGHDTPTCCERFKTCETWLKTWERWWWLTLGWRLTTEKQVVIHTVGASATSSASDHWSRVVASIVKFDAMCLQVVTAWRMLVVRETCIVHVLAHRQCKKFKAWWCCVGGLGRREECVCGNILVSNPLHATVSL